MFKKIFEFDSHTKGWFQFEKNQIWIKIIDNKEKSIKFEHIYFKH